MYVLMNDTLSPIPVCPESIYYYSAVDALYALCEMAVGMLCVWCVGLNDLKEHLIEIILTDIVMAIWFAIVAGMMLFT